MWANWVQNGLLAGIWSPSRHFIKQESSTVKSTLSVSVRSLRLLVCNTDQACWTADRHLKDLWLPGWASRWFSSEPSSALMTNLLGMCGRARWFTGGVGGGGSAPLSSPQLPSGGCCDCLGRLNLLRSWVMELQRSATLSCSVSGRKLI